MSDLIKAEEIIKIIPDLLIYFVPGFIFITIRNYKLSIDCEKDKYITLKSLVISYMIIKFINIFCSSNSYYFTFIVLMFSILGSILYVKLELEKKLLELLKVQKQPNKDYISNIINIKEGPWIYAYIEKERVVYVGKLDYYHPLESGKDVIIVLYNYIIYSYEDEEIKNYLNDNTRCAMLNTRDITRIEIVK